MTEYGSMKNRISIHFLIKQCDIILREKSRISRGGV